MSLGAYDNGVEEADNMSMTLPAHVAGQVVRGLFAMSASNEPESHAALKAAGFSALDSRDPSQALMHNCLSVLGGYYVDLHVSQSC